MRSFWKQPYNLVGKPSKTGLDFHQFIQTDGHRSNWPGRQALQFLRTGEPCNIAIPFCRVDRIRIHLKANHWNGRRNLKPRHEIHLDNQDGLVLGAAWTPQGHERDTMVAGNDCHPMLRMDGDGASNPAGNGWPALFGDRG
jgi:hypothetical protein